MFQDVVATLSAHFMDLPPERADAGIEEALEDCGRRLSADRTSVWLSAVDTPGFELARAWTAPGVEDFGRLDDLQGEGLLLEELPWLSEQLGKFETVHVADPSTLPQEAHALRAHLLETATTAALFVPMVSRGLLVGLLRIERVEQRAPWSQECLVLMRVVADLLVGLIERKRAEDSLRRSQDRLAQTQRLEVVGRLAGGIAHDFNNFLTAIMGYSDLLEGELDSSDPSLEEVHEIQRAADKASTLIEQILSFSRRQNGQPRIIDLNMAVAGLQKIISRVMGDEMELRCELREGAGSVLADPSRLEQVLVNLAVNARDAMPQGGTLTISTYGVCVEPGGRGIKELPCPVPATLSQGEYAVLSVRDTGSGMDKDTRQRLFEPFFTTKAAGRGTGLGLATVAAIVTESRGHIVVDSEPGAGAAFHIFLPTSAETVYETIASPQDHALSPMPRGRETILLVDPDAPVRQLLRRVLESLGYTVLEAVDPDTAEQVSRQRPEEIHLLVTDLALPRLCGREVAERVRELRPDLQVLFTSGYPEEMIRDAGICSEGTGLLEKPFSCRTLADKIRESLDA